MTQTTRVKTTRIEKTYKDRRTGEEKKIVIDYAKISDRIKEFRESCPFGDIDTQITFPTPDKVLVKAIVIKDKKEGDSSARGTGHAVGKAGDEKGLEKTETLAVGRALAMIGYAASGEVASAEEMEEFLAAKEAKKNDLVAEWSEKLGKVKTMDELRKLWADMPVAAKGALKPKQEEMKAIISSETND